MIVEVLNYVYLNIFFMDLIVEGTILRYGFKKIGQMLKSLQEGIIII